jgi:hypothetical protein
MNFGPNISTQQAQLRQALLCSGDGGVTMATCLWLALVSVVIVGWSK